MKIIKEYKLSEAAVDALVNYIIMTETCFTNQEDALLRKLHRKASNLLLVELDEQDYEF